MRKILQKPNWILPGMIEKLEFVGEHLLSMNSSSSFSKPDGSIVTAADLWANKEIEGWLLENCADFVVSEEGSGGFPKDDSSFWVLDPIDGTRGFVAGNGQWCIMLGKIESGKCVESYLYAPELGELYVSKEGEGSFFREGMFWEKLQIGEEKNDLVIVTNISSLNFFGENGVSSYSYGSMGLKMAHVALGKASCYLSNNRGCGIWDSAPGSLLVKEAGGIVLNGNGKEFLYEKERSPKFCVIAGRGDRANDMLKLMEGL